MPVAWHSREAGVASFTAVSIALWHFELTQLPASPIWRTQGRGQRRQCNVSHNKDSTTVRGKFERPPKHKIQQLSTELPVT